MEYLGTQVCRHCQAPVDPASQNRRIRSDRNGGCRHRAALGTWMAVTVNSAYLSVLWGRCLCHGFPGEQVQVCLSVRSLQARRSLTGLKPGGSLRAAETTAGHCEPWDSSWGGRTTLSSLPAGSIAERGSDSRGLKLWW